MRLYFLCFFVLLLFAEPVMATSFVMMTDDALLEQSSYVISGVVTDISYEQRGTNPETHYTIHLTETLKGSIEVQDITVAMPGGPAVDGGYLHVEGAPEYTIDQEVLLFLNPRQDGTYRTTQFLLGSFTVNYINDQAIVKQNLAGARELPPSEASPLSKSSRNRTLRDAESFKQWLRDRVKGSSANFSYWITEDQSSVSQASKYTHDGARWPDFDTTSIDWAADKKGMPNLAGNGFSEFQAAITAWNSDSGSNINFHYTGTTNATAGLGASDGINSILFEDPSNEIDGSYSCANGGTLAVGQWRSWDSHTYKGTNFSSIVEGDVVTQNGASCFFSGHEGKDGEEVFAHELGHTLGFGHTSETQALMYPSAHGDGRGADLRVDDRNAAHYLYEYTPVPPDTSPVPNASKGTYRNLIAVSWGTVNNASSYRLFRSTTQLETGVQVYSGGDLNFNDSQASVGVIYYYRLKACNDDGCSDAGNYDTGYHQFRSIVPIYDLLFSN